MDILYFITGVGLLKQFHDPPREWRFMDLSGVPFFYIISWILRLWLFPKFVRFGRRVLISTKGEEFARNNPDRIRHFAVRAYAEIFHVSTTVLCYFSFRNEDWWMNPRKMVFMFPPHESKYNFAMKVYYNFGIGNYLYKMVQLTNRTIRNGFDKDFSEVFVHHMITLLLMFNSYFSGYGHWGVLILYIHNFSDALTYIARMGNDLKHTVWMVASFPIMLGGWFSCRMFVFPYIVLGAIPAGRPLMEDHNTPLVMTFIFLLFSLYLMHVYWSYGICCVFYGIVSKGWHAKLVDEYNDGPIADPNRPRRRNSIKQKLEV